ncbi:hypothetical protein GCM10009830_24890 [Glycomyces endophyticus]|uniref:DUF3040 domain-containing protein n=1 Tax=Glycomyces endophyticus TaxID=480996 RepID=A0ABP4SS26_9ACTN
MPETPETETAAERPGREQAGRSGLLGSFDPVAAAEKRKARIREEIARNRRGEYTVPTWVLALALAGVLGIWALVLFVL